MAPSRSSKETDRDQNDQTMIDLELLINSVRLDGDINAAKVDELATAIQKRLNVSSFDKQVFRDMAKTFIRHSIKEQDNEANNEQESSPSSPSEKYPYKEAELEVPTWSQESSSPETADHSLSPRKSAQRMSGTPRLPTPSKAPRSPNPTIFVEAVNRGRSPARSNNANVTSRTPRSRTPVDRLPRFRKPPTADTRGEPSRSRSPCRTRSKSPFRSRSKSPFRALFRRGGNGYDDLPVEAASPSVYYESHMDMDSVLGGTPTPQRVPRRPEAQTPPSVGKPPLPSMNLNPTLSGTRMSSPFPPPPPPPPPRDAGATMPSPSQMGQPQTTTKESAPNLTASGIGASMMDLHLEDIQFSIGKSSPPARSPHAMKSPSSARSRRSSRIPVVSSETPMYQTPKNSETLNDDEMAEMFSPWEDTPPSRKDMQSPEQNSTPNRPWQEDVALKKGRITSRLNPRVADRKGTGGVSGAEPVRQRSRSPFRFFKGWRGNNSTPTEDTVQPVQMDASTGLPFTSPIPPFQAPDAVFAESAQSDRRQMAPLSMEDTAAATMGNRRQTAPPNMSVAAAIAAAGMEPMTPYESNNQTFPAAETADRAVNKKGRNTATPYVPDSSGIQFQVDLSKTRSLKNKIRAKRAQSLKRGLGGSNSAEISENTTDDNSRTASETTADFRMNMTVNTTSFAQNSDARDHGTQQTTHSTGFVSASMDVDNGTPRSQPTGLEEPILFNIGVGGKSPKARFKRRDNGPRGARFQQRSQSACLSEQDMPQDLETPLVQTASSESMGSTGGLVGQKPHYGRSFSDNASNLAAAQDMKLAKVMALREEGKSHYLSADYRSSILKYTKAIQAYASDCMEEPRRDLLAVLLSNRAAGLLMVGAFPAAAHDCKNALEFVSDPATYVTSSEAGPVLQSKLYTRMARALLKLGEADAADLAFNESIATATKSLELCVQQDSMLFEVAQKGLGQVITEATLGKTEVARFRDAMERIIACTQSSVHVGRSSEREKNLEAIGHVNMALSTATGCDLLHEQKVTLLASLKRWREVASHCERLAATNTKLDGCFNEDLASKHPYLGVPPAKHLTPDYFGQSREDELRGAETKLNSKAAAEAVLRIPHSMTPYYIRSLRLEERYPAAEATIRALEQFVVERAGVNDQERLRSQFVWLPREHDRLNRTKSEREKGDELFRNGDFERALAKYAACLLIDSEGSAADMDDSSAGGRLHAVLHCNRAACLMAVRRFHEAVTECTAALRIHSRYMKALLRRARCYSRLDRLEESVAEYKRWLEMVKQARNDPQSVSVFLTPCLFDGAHDVSQDDINQVKQELDEILKAKSTAEAAARSEAAYRQQRESRRSANDSQQADAQRRRDYFYSQKTSSRRWDSFADRGPKKSGKASSKGVPPRDESSSNKKSPKNSINSDDHYTVLQLKTSATDAEIKKAYRKMALKYHPDKNQDPGAVDSFRRVAQAYEVLNDSSSRRKYDTENRWRRRF